VTADQDPLPGFADRFVQASQASGGALELSVEARWRQVNLRIDPTAAGSLTDVLGGALPVEPNTVVSTDHRQLVWLGPDEWLVLSRDHAADPEPALRAAASAPVSVVDVSSARTIISVSGPAARDVLAHGCGLDLDAAQFPPGACAQTRLALANVVLIAPHDQPADVARSPRFLVLVRPSLAAYLATWLLDAATEYCADAGTAVSVVTSGLGPG
jgi:sarcosine oxidase subunit gamma